MSTNSRTPRSRKKTRTPGSTGGGNNPQATHLDYLPIMAAWRTDFWNTMNKLAPHVSANRDEDLWPIEGDAYLDLMQNRIDLALEYIILDTEELKECGGVLRSFEFGRALVSDLVLKTVIGNPDNYNFPERLPGNLEEKLIQLHACMIALIARGQSGSACELARMADVLFWIFLNLDSRGMLKPPYDKMLGPDKDKITLLLYLARCIQSGVLPTKKTLRVEVFGKNRDEGNFSRLLKGMGIREFIPHETTAQKDSAFHPIRRPLDGWKLSEEYIRVITSKKIDQSHSEDLVDAEPDVAPYCSIRPSGDPEMAQCEIRRIRESLGAAYWQLLIQFGMGELETPEDLQVFVERLASIGLDLK